MKSFILHDESVNTYGFRMLTAGANLEEFKKNPVMLLNHNDYALPIGRWENIRVVGTQILADPVFDMNDERGREVARKVREGFIKAASIGAWPPEDKTDDPLLLMAGQKYATVTKWTVREASICTIGANHNALAFYDRSTKQLIDLVDATAVVKLMDNSFLKPNNMNINQLLQLSDSASEQEQTAAIEALVSDNERLKGENKFLKDTIDKVNKDKANAITAEAITLVDTAVRDGRISAEGKSTYIALFDKDFDAAKKALAAIPARRSVAAQMGRMTTMALADFTGKSWDELDRAGKLTLLKDNYPDVYSEKFRERFGVEPNL